MSAQKIQLTGPDGKPQEYPVYTDNRELAKDYAAGEIHDGDLIVYSTGRPLVAEVMNTFVDQDGDTFAQLLALAPLMGMGVPL